MNQNARPMDLSDCGCRIDRRGFLAAGAGFAATLFAPALWARAAASGRRDGNVFVLLELAGGNDGLNTVVPYGDDAYHRARGAIAIPATDVLRIDDRVGLHPSLAKLKPLYDNGRLAIVEGAGYPDPIRSHFLSMDVWHTASAEGRRKGSGWIGRLADLEYAALDDPNAVIALDQRVPYSCEGEKFRALALAAPRAFKVIGDDKMVETLDSAVSSQQVSERARKFLRDAYLGAREASEAIAKATAAYKPAVEYPRGNELATDLSTVVSLIAGGLGTRVFAVSTGGFDTHAGQVQRQQKLLADVSASLSAFFADLDAHGLSERVIVLAFSEFGRRVKPNASGGTDHGTAAPLFAVGEKVKGGLYGAPPSLDKLDANGDLIFTTDFRRAYATVIDRWLGGKSEAVLGARYEPLPFLA